MLLSCSSGTHRGVGGTSPVPLLSQTPEMSAYGEWRTCHCADECVMSVLPLEADAGVTLPLMTPPFNGINTVHGHANAAPVG